MPADWPGEAFLLSVEGPDSVGVGRNDDVMEVPSPVSEYVEVRKLVIPVFVDCGKDALDCVTVGGGEESSESDFILAVLCTLMGVSTSENGDSKDDEVVLNCIPWRLVMPVFNEDALCCTAVECRESSEYVKIVPLLFEVDALVCTAVEDIERSERVKSSKLVPLAFDKGILVGTTVGFMESSERVEVQNLVLLGFGSCGKDTIGRIVVEAIEDTMGVYSLKVVDLSGVSLPEMSVGNEMADDPTVPGLKPVSEPEREVHSGIVGRDESWRRQLGRTILGVDSARVVFEKTIGA